MSLKVCLPGLVEEKKLTREQADRAAALFDRIEGQLKMDMGEDAAAALASTETLKVLDAEAARKRFLAGRTIATRQRMEADLAGFGGGKGGGGDGGPIDPAAGPAFFVPRKGADYANLEGRRQAIQRRAFGMMADAVQRLKAGVVGEGDVALSRDVVREVYGESTGSAMAKRFAEGWGMANEYVRQRFNAAGGGIGKTRDGRGYMPTLHNATAVRRAGFQAWRDNVWDKLDRRWMLDRETGRPLDDAGLYALLRQVFDTIRTEGWFNREPGGAGEGMIANRRADARVLIFKDADSWLAYNDEFGQTNVLGAMVGHIKGMSRDTAAMEIFGPNPETGIKWLRETIEKSARVADDKGEALKAARPAIDRIDALWKEFNGANMRPSREWLANAGSTIRAYETAKTLGSASISAFFGDIGTQHLAAGMNDLPFTRVMAQQFRLLNPANAVDRLLAARMGLIFDGWINDAAGRMRAFSGDEFAAGKMGHFSESVLRATGLNAWTNTGQAAWGMTVLGHMADVRGKAWSALDDGFRGLLERGGFNAAEWDAVRATAPRNEMGHDWLFPQDIERGQLGDKVLAMLSQEQNFAVQEADFETRAVMHDGMRRGTVKGEVVQSTLLLKSFGIGTVLTHGRRIMTMGSWSSRLRYATRLAITLTMAGAATIQIKEIAKGRGMRSMDPFTEEGRNFWLDAVLQGGGLGVLGDILHFAADPRISNAATYLGGPVADSIGRFGALAYATGKEALHEMGLAKRGANWRGKAVDTLEKELPGGSVWYLRLALQRWLFDNLREAADPHYRDHFRRQKRAVKKAGQDWWWEPGDNLPTVLQ